jgi:hypothetical protein
LALPRLEPPDDALVLFERVPDGADRSGAMRFAVTASGTFLHSRNEHFEIDDDRIRDDEPALFWAGPLDEVARFDEDHRAVIARHAEAIRDLPEQLRRPPGTESGPVTERITVFTHGAPKSTTYPARARPEAVQRLLDAIDRAGRGGPPEGG